MSLGGIPCLSSGLKFVLPEAGSIGSIPGQKTKILHVPKHNLKEKKKDFL